MTEDLHNITALSCSEIFTNNIPINIEKRKLGFYASQYCAVYDTGNYLPNQNIINVQSEFKTK